MKHDSLCETKIDDAGLPYRTEQLLNRERRSFVGQVVLLFTAAKGEIEPPPLTAAALDQALGSDQPGRARAAAFLIGRCRAIDPEVDRFLLQRLCELSDRALPSEVAIEVGMSLVLRGRAQVGRKLLHANLHRPGPIDNAYLAAFYLAQIGDPSGYGVLVRTLASEIPHYRLMALRHALGFLPYDGQSVDGMTVDVRSLLVERLGDPDELVRSEVPFYLEELKLPDLRALLAPIEKHDSSPLVQSAARAVLERNP